MKDGDLVTSYWSGYYKIIKIIDREAPNKELVELEQIFDSKGVKLKKTKFKSCDISYCKPAKEHIQNEIMKLQNILNNLKEML